MEIHPSPLQEQLNTIHPYILESAFAALSPEWRLNLRTSPYSRLYYFTEGEAWAESGGKRITMQAGHFYLIPAGLAFSAGCEGAAKKLYFHLNLLKRDGYDLAMDLKEIFSLPVEQQRLEWLVALCGERSICSALQLKTMLMEDLLTVFEQHNAGAAESVYSVTVQQTVRYIRSHLSVSLSVRGLAERFFISERALNNIFRREMGKTVGQYIDEMVLFEAQRQLLLTERSVSEISEGLGFCDQFYFSRRFKQCCGKTPLAYRKEGKL